MTLQYLGELPDGLAELGNLTPAVRRQLHMCKHHRIESQLAPVEDHSLRLDQADVLESLYPPPAG